MRKLPVGLHGEEHEAGRPRHRPGKLIPTNPANRIPLLTAGKVDVVFASFTITDERAKVVDFTTPYFLVGQQFLANKGVLTDASPIKDLRIGTEKGTTMESNCARATRMPTSCSMRQPGRR